MRSSMYPPGNRSVMSESNVSISAALIALAAIALNFFNFLAGTARTIASVIAPEPRLAFAGGAEMSMRAGGSPRRDLKMLLNTTRAGRSDHRGTRHAAGQFGGGGHRFPS